MCKHSKTFLSNPLVYVPVVSPHSCWQHPDLVSRQKHRFSLVELLHQLSLWVLHYNNTPVNNTAQMLPFHLTWFSSVWPNTAKIYVPRLHWKHTVAVVEHSNWCRTQYWKNNLHTTLCHNNLMLLCMFHIWWQKIQEIQQQTVAVNINVCGNRVGLITWRMMLCQKVIGFDGSCKADRQQ